jgi:hypothetical protein
MRLKSHVSDFAMSEHDLGQNMRALAWNIEA